MVKMMIYKILNNSSNFKSIRFFENNEYKDEDVIPQKKYDPFSVQVLFCSSLKAQLVLLVKDAALTARLKIHNLLP
jgi:hypothetical protein